MRRTCENSELQNNNTRLKNSLIQYVRVARVQVAEAIFRCCYELFVFASTVALSVDRNCTLIDIHFNCNQIIK